MKIRLVALSLAAALPIASTLSAQVTPAKPVAAPAPAVPTTPMKPARPTAQDGAVAPAKQTAAPAEAAPKIDEKAKAIYDKGIAAAQALKSIDLVTQMKLDMPGVDPAMLPPGFGTKSRVRIKFDDAGAEAAGDAGAAPSFAMFGGTVCIERLDGGKVVERFVSAKDAALLVMPEAKTYSSSDDMMQLMGASVMALPQWIMEQRAAAKPGREQAGMMMPPSTIVSAALAGVETIDDLECDVVKVVRELDMSGLVVDGDAPEGMPAKMRLNETIAFARTDGMPRRLSMMPVMDEMQGDEMGTPVGPTTTWTAVTVNAEFAPEVFSTVAPEGFAKVDPPANPMVQGMALEGEGEMPEPELAFKVGDAAPEFALKDLAGTEVTLASLKGKVVLLDFWATWCGPCKMAMPTIQKLHEEYASKGVAILGVNTWEKKADAAKAYMESKKFTYPCLLDGDKLAESYGIRGIPTLVVIGKDGKLALLEVGLSDASGNGLRKAIDAALAK